MIPPCPDSLDEEKRARSTSGITAAPSVSTGCTKPWRDPRNRNLMGTQLATTKKRRGRPKCVPKSGGRKLGTKNKRTVLQERRQYLENAGKRGEKLAVDWLGDTGSIASQAMTAK